MPGELVFGYVGDLKIFQKSYFYQDPVPDHMDPKWGSKITGKLRTQFLQQLKEQPSVMLTTILWNKGVKFESLITNEI